VSFCSDSMCRRCNKRPAKRRGVCDSCYTIVKRQIKKGKTTEAKQMQLGIFLPVIKRWVARNRWYRGSRKDWAKDL
jgi:hypothetical protein